MRCLATVAAVRCGLSLASFRNISQRIARLEAGGEPTVDELRRVAWGVTAASRLVPFASCLTQALSGQYLLAREGKTSQVRIGIERCTGADMRAHAWLVSGPHIVLGGAAGSFDRYAHLATLGGRP